MKENEFIEALKKINIIPTSTQMMMLKKYASYLMEYNKHTNLTAIKDVEGIYLKHFYDSLLVSEFFDFNSVISLIDIGSGAGFPGVVLKIFYPHLKVTLLDSNNKKITFLNNLIENLCLENINTVNERAENYVQNHRHEYDVTIARAVSELRVIAELCLPLTKVNGNFIAMKAKYEDEFKSIDGVLKNLNSTIESINEAVLPFENSSRSFINFKVMDIINKKYPRAYDQIIKKELK